MLRLLSKQKRRGDDGKEKRKEERRRIYEQVQTDRSIA